MLIGDIIELAKDAELKQLAIRNDNSVIMGFINLGLIELYKRFPLKESEAIITLQEGKTLYTLDGTDLDVVMEDNDDLMFVSLAYDESGEQIILNDESDPLGVNTPSYNTVEVPNVAQDEKISIIYRCSPAFVTSTEDNLRIPTQMIEALLNYIGYRGHGSVKGDIKSENNTHYMRFNDSCKRLLAEGLFTTDDLISNKFEDKGFV